MCRTTLVTFSHFHFGDVFWPHLDPCVLSIPSILICFLLHLLRSLLTKFEFIAIISPIWAAGKAKGDDFDV